MTLASKTVWSNASVTHFFAVFNCFAVELFTTVPPPDTPAVTTDCFTMSCNEGLSEDSYNPLLQCLQPRHEHASAQGYQHHGQQPGQLCPTFVIAGLTADVAKLSYRPPLKGVQFDQTTKH